MNDWISSEPAHQPAEASRSQAAWRRTEQLLAQGRWDEARAWIAKVLAADPDDALQLLALAECEFGLENYEEARRILSRLKGLIGPEAILYRLESRLDLAQGKPRDAQRSALAAVSADPADADNHVALARCACARQDWEAMESHLRHALSLEGEHAEALHLLSIAQNFQGRTDDAQETAHKLIGLDPESSTGHSVLGWASLHAGDRATAENEFRESLRIDPTSPGARAGLLESLRARNLPYRAYLGWNRFMNGLSGSTRNALVFGLLIGMNLLSRVRGGMLGALASAAVFLYFAFVMWTWVAPGVGNLFLLASGTTRRLLRQEETLSAIFVGGAFLAGFLVSASVLMTGSAFSVYGGGALLFSAIASSLWIGNEHPTGKWVYAAAAFGVPLTMLATLLGFTTWGRHFSMAFLVLTIAGSFRVLRR